jgi:hypothetical protein|nr:MAG TPA: hypothetical protein [Caudoviricetes sp.]
MKRNIFFEYIQQRIEIGYITRLFIIGMMIIYIISEVLYQIT